MLRILLLSLITINLVGCAQLIVATGDSWDRADMCQKRFRSEDYQIPLYCSAGTNRTVIYNNSGQPVGFIRK